MLCGRLDVNFRAGKEEKTGRLCRRPSDSL